VAASNRRSEIVDAAMTLFAGEGYRGTSLASIAETVGLTLPGLLHYFPSKQELLVAVLEERDRRDEAAAEERYAMGQDLFTGLELLVAHNAESPNLVKLFTVLVGEAAVSPAHPAHEHIARRYRYVTDAIAARVGRSIELGDVPPDVDPEVLARLLMAVMDGLQIQWLLDEDLEMTALLRAFLDLVRQAARAAPGVPTD
jgi:AcrR family transcriptional regulator